MDDMKEIFVVDGELETYPVQVPKAEWEKKNYIVAKIGLQPIIIKKKDGINSRLTVDLKPKKRQKDSDLL